MMFGKCKFLVALVLIVLVASSANAQTLLVARETDNAVGEYATNGTYMGDFVAAGSGGLSTPSGLRFGPDGNLYVTSADTGSVKKYDGVTGAYLGDFVSGMDYPLDCIFDAAGNCYVADTYASTVYEFSPAGTLLNSFMSLISTPEGLAFLPDGDLLVTNTYSGPTANTITEIDPATGAASTFATGLGEPVGITVGPDGRYYVANYTFADSYGGTNPDTVQVVAATGGVSSTFASGGGLDGTSYLTFAGGKLFVTSLYNGFVVVFDGITGQPTGAFSVSRPEGITTRPESAVKISAIAVSPATVIGGNTATGKITLSKPAPSSGAVVVLSSGNPATSVQKGITIPAGARSVTFPISTVPVSTLQSGQITATSANAVHVVLNVRPIGVKSLSLSKTTVKGGKAVVGKVTLELLAAPAGIAVTFTSSNTNVVSTPAGITVQAGQQTGAFAVSTNAVTTTTPVTITATANGITKSVTLTVTP